MKLRLFTKAQPPPEPEIFIQITESYGVLRADVVDSLGNRVPQGLLFQLGPKGLLRYMSVSPNFGIPLDSEGRIQISEERF